MRRVSTIIVAVCLGLALAVPTLAQDDDELARLLKLRRAALDEFTDVSLRLAQVELRQGSPDWLVLKADDGSLVEIGPTRLRKLVPWVQMALADQGAAPVLLETLSRHYPEAVLAAVLAPDEMKPYLAQLRHLFAGDLEALDPDIISKVLGTVLADPGLRAKLDVDANYAALDAELDEQRQALEVLLQVLDAEVEARGGTVPPEPSPQPSLDPCEADGENAVDILCSAWGNEATPVPEAEPTWEPSLPPTEIEELPTPTPAPTAAPTPEPEPSPEPTPGMESEGIEYDALEGLTHCESDDPDCVEASPATCSEADMWCDDSAPEPPAAEPPADEPTPEEIAACFDDEEGWTSWRATFGDVLPSWCSSSEPVSSPEPSPEPAADAFNELADALSLWDGCWATPWGRLRLDESGSRVSGTLTWTDQTGVARDARLELEPLVEGYSDRLIGGLFDAPPTDGITCASTSGGTDHWASARLDYRTDRSFHASFLPCLDDELYGRVQLDGTWESTLDECGSLGAAATGDGD